MRCEPNGCEVARHMEFFMEIVFGSGRRRNWMDNITSEQRKKNMTAIKDKKTRIENILCKALWQKGYRYRRCYNKLPGKPDIVFIGRKVVVFCDSEFWHGRNYDQFIARIGTNQEYWAKKIKRNMERDKEVTADLERIGWMVLRFWGKQITKETDYCVAVIENALKS
jgi:DNA mismatch endonuclease Vsr